MFLKKKDLDRLEHCFLFFGLSRSEISALLECRVPEIECFPCGALIYGPTSYRRALGILLSGEIKVSKGEHLVVSRLSPGDIFGAAALFNEEQRYVSSLTAVTGCRILFLTQDTISSMMTACPGLGENYIRYLSGRIRFLSEKVDLLTQNSGRSKVLKYLHTRANEQGEVLLSCPLSELAMLLDMSRAALYRELDKLEAEQLLLRRGRLICLTSLNP